MGALPPDEASPASPGPILELSALTVDRAVLLELVGIALAAGTSVPDALKAVGRAVGGVDGEVLRAAGTSLRLGASWAEAWSGCPSRLDALREALSRVWGSGASPTALLRDGSEQLRRDRKKVAREAAAQLGARLVIPLGLCHLPAFVLLGLVPVIISLGRGII